MALPRGFMTQCNNARRNMGMKYDWFSSDAMSSYFLQLYSRVQTFDKKDMKYYLYNRSLTSRAAQEEWPIIHATEEVKSV